MKKFEQDFTKGRLGIQILLFSIPLIFSNLLQVLFNMADIAVVGRFAGSTALGAVGSTTTLVTLFTGLLIGMSGGINVLVAHNVGAKNSESTKQVVHTAAIISLLVGIIIMLFAVFFSEGILRIMKTKDELIDGATAYLRIYFLGMPALAIYNYGNAVLSAVGDTKRPLIYLSIAGAVNVILNLFFVIVCKLGVVGVALASIISQYISAVLIIKVLLKADEDYGLKLKELRISRHKAKVILGISIPAGA